MLAQCAIPWASPGHMRGLTLQRLFKKVLAVGAPDLFLSSFNEHIGGRQKPSQAARVAINMGLPYDSQRSEVWVDTYGSEFSRDLEPSEEGGGRVWEVAQSCIALYRQGISSCDVADGAQVILLLPTCSSLTSLHVLYHVHMCNVILIYLRANLLPTCRIHHAAPRPTRKCGATFGV